MEEKSRDVQKGDELDYRISLRRLVDTCLFFLEHDTLHIHVGKLETALNFNADGLPLSNEIDEARKERDKIVHDFTVKEKRRLGRDFYGQPHKAFFHIDVYFIKWRSYLNLLIQLMSKHGMLLHGKSFVEAGEV